MTCTYAIDPLAPTYNHYTYTYSSNINNITSLAQTRPGSTWLLGNEIERIDWAGGSQDEILPELYADFYHEVATAIKNADPTAQVAIGAVIEPTPLRLQYLTQVWNQYLAKYGSPMPVDVWNIHLMILQEKSCLVYPTDCWGADIPAGVSAPGGVGMTFGGSANGSAQLANKNFTGYGIPMIQAMRQWMQAHGQQGKPLIISEYTVLFPPSYTFDGGLSYPFTNDQVRDSYMYPSFTYFLTTGKDCTLSSIDSCGLVQRWLWYSLDDDTGDFGGDLMYSGLQSGLNGITTLGGYWMNYVQPLPPGATKPYAPAQSAAAVRLPASSPASEPAPAGPENCAGKTQIRQIFAAPSSPGDAIVGLSHQSGLAPQVLKIVTICLPSN